MPGDLTGGGRLAEPGDVFVLASTFVSAPSVVCRDDLLEVRLGQLAVDPVNQRAQLAGIDEQRLSAAIAAFAVVLLLAVSDVVWPIPLVGPGYQSQFQL